MSLQWRRGSCVTRQQSARGCSTFQLLRSTLVIGPVPSGTLDSRHHLVKRPRTVPDPIFNSFDTNNFALPPYSPRLLDQCLFNSFGMMSFFEGFQRRSICVSSPHAGSQMGLGIFQTPRVEDNPVPRRQRVFTAALPEDMQDGDEDIEQRTGSIAALRLYNARYAPKWTRPMRKTSNGVYEWDFLLAAKGMKISKRRS